jgi:hypothetical protein
VIIALDMQNDENIPEDKQENNPPYRVVPPDELYRNKRYGEWVQDWSNWFYRINPDQNNEGDVVFLRGMPSTGTYLTEEAVVMIGNESLEISENQRVLIPIITANYVAENSESSEYLYGMVRSHIFNGDHPPLPQQIRINGEPIQIDNLSAYEIETPIFMINIPDTSGGGMSLKDQMESPIQSAGFFPSVTRGYFVMLELYAGNDYYIECYSTGAPTAVGPYHVSLFYHVLVKANIEQQRSSIPPSRLSKKILSKAREKCEKEEIDPREFDRIKCYLDYSVTDIDNAVTNMSRRKK